MTRTQYFGRKRGEPCPISGCPERLFWSDGRSLICGKGHHIPDSRAGVIHGLQRIGKSVEGSVNGRP